MAVGCSHVNYIARSDPVERPDFEPGRAVGLQPGGPSEVNVESVGKFEVQSGDILFI